MIAGFAMKFEEILREAENKTFEKSPTEDEIEFFEPAESVPALSQNTANLPTGNSSNEAGVPNDIPTSPSQNPTAGGQVQSNTAEGTADIPVPAPPPSGMLKKAAAWVAGLGLGLPSLSGLFESARGLVADGTIRTADVVATFGTIFKFVLPYAIWIGVAFIVFWGLKEVLKQFSFIVQMWTAAKKDLNTVKPMPTEIVGGEWRFVDYKVKENPIEIWKEK
jgi:hypothetical protein